MVMDTMKNYAMVTIIAYCKVLCPGDLLVGEVRIKSEIPFQTPRGTLDTIGLFGDMS